MEQKNQAIMKLEVKGYHEAQIALTEMQEDITHAKNLINNTEHMIMLLQQNLNKLKRQTITIDLKEIPTENTPRNNKTDQ